MSEKQIFIFGAGYSGKAFARASKDAGTILGTTRAPEKFEALRQAGIQPLLFDGALTLEISDALEKTTHLVVSVAPEEAGDPVLNAARQTIAARCRRSNGSPISPPSASMATMAAAGSTRPPNAGRCRSARCMRVAAEQDWLKLGRDIGRPVAILRLSGIYGPGRNALVNLENGTARRLIKPGQVFNRIHCDDIAGALWHLLKDIRGGIFNVTDDLPAPPQDVVTYAAGLMGVTPPPEIPFETAQLSPMARSFYGENKRVANTAIKAAGYRFRFPDYRSAFDHMWAEGNWRDGEARSPMKRS